MGVTDGIRFKSKSSERMAAQLCFTERQATAILEMRLQLSLIHIFNRKDKGR